MRIEESEFVVPSIENLMPQKDIELDGQQYRIYLEENINAPDRCFGVSSTDNPQDIKLFQIAIADGDKNMSRLPLAAINIENRETAENLLRTALEIVKGLTGKTGNIQMADLTKKLEIKNNSFHMTYQPPTAGIANMREQYEKRVVKRIYGY
ncbi:MAG: hypothetical protein ACOX0R_01455 [Candidatus Dojkabacteria bacterium]|jgi:hypothetical protein